YRRQKHKHEVYEQSDDEKMAMTHPDVLPLHPEPEMTATAAPHLTQFNPNLDSDQENTAHSDIPASASAPNPKRPGSRNAANDPANPFGNHAETITSPNGSRPGTAQAPAQALTTPDVTPLVSPVRDSSPQDINPADIPLPSSRPRSPHTSSFDSNVPG